MVTEARTQGPRALANALCKRVGPQPGMKSDTLGN